MAEVDLEALLAGLEPVLAGEVYGFACIGGAISGGAVSGGAVLGGAVPGGVVSGGAVPFAVVAEAEGLTVVAPEAQLRAAGVAFRGGWARISLTVVSDLAAVGLTAAIASALTLRGISANVIAGYHHDHFFVQGERAEEALAVLRGLGGSSSKRGSEA